MPAHQVSIEVITYTASDNYLDRYKKPKSGVMNFPSLECRQILKTMHHNAKSTMVYISTTLGHCHRLFSTFQRTDSLLFSIDCLQRPSTKLINNTFQNDTRIPEPSILTTKSRPYN